MDKYDIPFLILTVVIALALMVYSFFGIFHTRKLIDFNLSYIKKSWVPNQYEWHRKMSEKKWFYYNIKICSIFGMLMSIGMLYAVIHEIFK